MKRTGKLAALAVTAVAVGGLSGGIALAQPSQNPPAATVRPAAAEPTVPDTDNLQEGDQTAPDNAAGVASTVVGSAAQRSAVNGAAPAAQRAVPNATSEQPEQESEGASESESPAQSDGPGGHEDPPGDVQHEGAANER